MLNRHHRPDASNRDLLARRLGREGYRVTAAESGTVALASSHPASLLSRRRAPPLCGHALAVTAPHEPAYQLSRHQHRRSGPASEPWRGARSQAAAPIVSDEPPRFAWVSAPGDYAIVNSNQTPDGTRPRGRDREFANSPLEEAGFEPSVPRQGAAFFTEGNELYPLPINHQVGDHESGEKRLSRGRRTRCQRLRSLH